MGAGLAIGPCAISADIGLERRYLGRKTADGVVGFGQQKLVLGCLEGTVGFQAIALRLMPCTGLAPDRNPLVLGRPLERGDDAFKFLDVVEH